MRRWVIADTHFDHFNIIKYGNRPYSTIEEMGVALMKKWNAVVGRDDLVYILGDFTLTRNKSRIAELASQLNGRKILIMGNHDTRKPSDYIECGFCAATRRPILLEWNVVLMHEPPLPEHVWDKTFYIYGHVHNKPSCVEDLPNCYCVSVERINYVPMDLDALLKKMKQRMEITND